jgi:hypothetical protein
LDCRDEIRSSAADVAAPMAKTMIILPYVPRDARRKNPTPDIQQAPCRFQTC